MELCAHLLFQLRTCFLRIHCKAYSRPPVPLGVGGLELLYAFLARYRAGVLSAVAYCGPSRAGSQVVSSVYLLILLVLPPSQLFSIGGVWGSLPLFCRFGVGCGRSWSRGLGASLAPEGVWGGDFGSLFQVPVLFPGPWGF